MKTNNSAISAFSNTYDLRGLTEEPTCCKNPNRPSCIDLVLTKKLRSFQYSFLIETGLSDSHKMKVTAMKTFFERLQPRVVRETTNILKMTDSELICCHS